MSDEITIDGEQYISSRRASELTKYAQDYVGQLARGGQVRAKRVGGLWYVAKKSLDEHKTKADSYKPIPPGYHQNTEQESLLSFDGKTYISSQYAAKLTGYSPDYVGQLARAGTVLSRQVGNRWYVERQSILAHKDSKDGLLADVQAESVGIKRQETGEKTLDAGGYRSAGTFYTYSSDSRDLVPFTRNDGASVAVKEETIEPTIPIPIRVVRRVQPAIQGSHALPTVSGGVVVRTSGKTMNYLAIPAIALTVVIILSLGFVSIREYSKYTISGIEISEHSGQAAAAGITDTLRAYAITVGDFLEVYLTTELVYRRSSQ